MTSIAGMLPLQLKSAPTGQRVDSQDDEATASPDFTALLQTALAEHKSGSALSSEEESDTPEEAQIHPEESGAEVQWSATESAPVFIATLTSDNQPWGEHELQPPAQSTAVRATATDAAQDSESNSATHTAPATNVAPEAEPGTAPDSASEAAVKPTLATNPAHSANPTHVPKSAFAAEPTVSTVSSISALATTGTAHSDFLDPERTPDDGESTVVRTVGADKSTTPLLRSATQPHSATPSHAETELPAVPPPPNDLAENSASEGPGAGVQSPTAPAITVPQASPVVTPPAANPTSGTAAAAEPLAVPPPAVVPQSPIAVAAPAAAIPASLTTAPPAMLSPQLAAPVHQLVSKGDGSHTLTLRVSPERLGPVTVQAHIQGEKIKIELFSAMEMGRDALRSVLSDLRRDLAGLGMSTGTTVLTVSDADSPTTQSQGQQSRTTEQHSGQWTRQGTPGEHPRDETHSDSPSAPAVSAQMTDHPIHRSQGESLDLFA